MSARLLLALLFLLPLTACPSAQPADDDDITPPDDDDDATAPPDDDDAADDDDSTPLPPPVMTMTPSEVDAGSVVAVQVDLENFTIDQGTGVAGAAAAVNFIGLTEQVQTDNFNGRFFFGLFAEGPQAFGLQNGAGLSVQADFELAPLAPEDIGTLTPQQPGSVTLAEADDFGVFEVDHAGANTVFMARATELGDEAMHPALLLVDETGNSVDFAAGFAAADGSYPEPLIAFDVDPGTWFVQVSEADGASGANFSAAIEYQAFELGAVVETPEVEPNGLVDDWQDLGTLSPGQYLVTGTSLTAGHDTETNNLNADLDVFRFAVSEDTIARFTLDWPGTAEDFDAVLHGDADGVQLGFDSDSNLSGNVLANTDQPQVAVLGLEAGVGYVLEIGNWEGSADAEWSLAIKVMPGSWPEPLPPPGR